VGTDVKTGRKASTEERNLGTARLSLTTNRKVEFASRASKKIGYDFAARRAREHAARRYCRAAQKRRSMEAAKTTIRYCLVMLDLLSDKQRRYYKTQKVMRGLV
jgi:hypothetical protein